LADFNIALLGAVVWGLGIGVYESIILPPSHRWCRCSAEPRPLACSPPDMASRGFSAALGDRVSLRALVIGHDRLLSRHQIGSRADLLVGRPPVSG
jgi:hypothetical protein